MKKEQLKRIEKETEQNLQETREQVKEEILEFQSVEELIRYDSHKTKLPETLWNRIRKSISNIPISKPFWKRLFGKK